MYDYIMPPEVTDVMPFLWNGFDTLVGYTYQVPVTEAQQWASSMSSSHRRDLRKAWDLIEQTGGRIEQTSEFDEAYELFSDTFETKEFKLRSNRESLERWWQSVVCHDAGTIYVAREADGRPVCATLLLLDRQCSYYLASGIRKDARHGPLNLWSRALIDRMIRESHESGLTFDFEGSILPGVERFFRGWGGRCVPKYRVVKVVSPWS